ncbi:MAG TPA: type II toxin-antitoxin system VapC family toxin [Solirubrobacteraceae bacterium]|nr:type II toxin-antitoxin system VapC family toxin [Solirubrobacteraceae bacterium]
MRRLLLDTNVVLWLLLGQRSKVPGATAAELEAPGNAVSVSAASVWEIAIKRSLGKLELPSHWCAALLRLDLDHLPITALHAAEVERLPLHHRDPFDRLLIAQAKTERMALVSADARLKHYGVEVLWQAAEG